MAALLAANNASIATVIHPGDVMCVPGGAVTPPAASTTTTKPPASTSPAPAPSGGTITIRQFPVQGLCWFTDTWGAPRSGGRRHEGVDILAKTGKAVYAVDDGTLTKQYIDSPGALAATAGGSPGPTARTSSTPTSASSLPV